MSQPLGDGFPTYVALTGVTTLGGGLPAGGTVLNPATFPIQGAPGTFGMALNAFGQQGGAAPSGVECGGVAVAAGGSIAIVAGIVYKEHTIKPAGWNAGGPNDTTSMRNTRLRTKQPKKLITGTDFKCNVFYDPAFMAIMVNVIGNNQLCVVRYPDQSTVWFWGWVDSLDPQEIKEGEAPLAELTVCLGNQDNTGKEVFPAYLPPSSFAVFRASFAAIGLI